MIYPYPWILATTDPPRLIAFASAISKLRFKLRLSLACPQYAISDGRLAPRFAFSDGGFEPRVAIRDGRFTPSRQFDKFVTKKGAGVVFFGGADFFFSSIPLIPLAESV
ncbi:MAG: hypothetical protein PUE80_07395 [bacterium]|nr:hypothetical protein [bacterium]MDD6900638.1 hypothetical protein [bacterium]MDY4185338.1 hypothetical protein [Sodaliphilus sp.]